MYQGTTPIFILTVGDDPTLDLSDKSVYVTIRAQDGQLLTKSNDDLDITGRRIAVRLTQAETLDMKAGYVQIQVRWIDSEGNAMATKPTAVTVDGVLLKEVIEYGGH